MSEKIERPAEKPSAWNRDQAEALCSVLHPLEARIEQLEFAARDVAALAKRVEALEAGRWQVNGTYAYQNEPITTAGTADTRPAWMRAKVGDRVKWCVRRGHTGFGTVRRLPDAKEGADGQMTVETDEGQPIYLTRAFGHDILSILPPEPEPERPKEETDDTVTISIDVAPGDAEAVFDAVEKLIGGMDGVGTVSVTTDGVRPRSALWVNAELDYSPPREATPSPSPGLDALKDEATDDDRLEDHYSAMHAAFNATRDHTRTTHTAEEHEDIVKGAIDAYRAYALGLAERVQPEPAPAVPSRCDGLEQDAFEAWAKSQHHDMSEHPLHWLFLDPKTNAAREGWAAGLTYAAERMKGLLASAPKGTREQCLQICARLYELGDGNPHRMTGKHVAAALRSIGIDVEGE